MDQSEKDWQSEANKLKGSEQKIIALLNKIMAGGATAGGSEANENFFQVAYDLWDEIKEAKESADRLIANDRERGCVYGVVLFTDVKKSFESIEEILVCIMARRSFLSLTELAAGQKNDR